MKQAFGVLLSEAKQGSEDDRREPSGERSEPILRECLWRSRAEEWGEAPDDVLLVQLLPREPR